MCPCWNCSDHKEEFITQISHHTLRTALSSRMDLVSTANTAEYQRKHNNTEKNQGMFNNTNKNKEQRVRSSYLQLRIRATLLCLTMSEIWRMTPDPCAKYIRSRYSSQKQRCYNDLGHETDKEMSVNRPDIVINVTMPIGTTNTSTRVTENL